jgi:O-acetyl-ADP-ribose deacetylase (regulator of RNase III)
MLSAASNFLKKQTPIEKVVFCLFGKESYDTFCAELAQLK